MERTDILVIGSGISGLFFALKTIMKRPDLSITVMTKSEADNSNTRFAQGGLAVVTNHLNDSFENHVEDTIRAGGGLGNREVIEMVVRQAPERLKELLDFEVTFDKNNNGEWNLGLEGGHSQPRILHHKDISGLEIQQKMLRQIRKHPNVSLKENCVVLDLISQERDETNPCGGAVFYNKKTKKTETIVAKAVVLSTGGCGQVFQYTTNPLVATGDGVAMAYRLGAEIADMQYIQFHPTALYEQDKNPYFLISEAVRGFGAYIVNDAGERFVFKQDPRGELATRDIVTRAIGNELTASGKSHVYIDCRHLDYYSFYKHFPTITDYCKNAGIDIRQDLIPVVPVAHYQCGGIKVDKDARTSVDQLFAVGECSCTGLHGKNRLASNSLLEALVYAHQCAMYLCHHIDKFVFLKEPGNIHFEITEALDEDLDSSKKELKEIMTSLFLGKVETNRVREAMLSIEKKVNHNFDTREPTLALAELQNMLAVSRQIVEQKNDMKVPV